MNPNEIIKIIMEKGLKNTDISMFPETERKAILTKLAEEYLRQGKTNDLLDILQEIDLKRFSVLMEKLAEDCITLGEYKKAALIYEKIGNRELADAIRENLL